MLSGSDVSSSSSSTSSSNKNDQTSIPDLSAADYLYLPNLNDDENKNSEYLIAMSPMNSSGDIYHILSYLILADSHGKKLPKVLLTYDSSADLMKNESDMNTYSQVYRSLAFASAIGHKANFAELKYIDTGNCQRENTRHKRLVEYLSDLVPSARYIDQKVVTTLIAYYFLQFGREDAVKRLRQGYMRRDTKFVPADVNVLIEKRVADELKKIKTHAAKQPLIVLHVRYSSKANNTQNVINTSFVNQLQRFLDTKGYKTWCILADGRMKGTSFKGIGENRTNPFSPSAKDPLLCDANNDRGKLIHSRLLHDLALPEYNVKGVIGNTSGTLDLAAFLGHKVMNLHQFDGSIAYQEVRIILQSTFLSLEFMRGENLQNATSTADKKKGELTDEILDEQLPNLKPWLEQNTQSTNFLPKKPGAIANNGIKPTKYPNLFAVKIMNKNKNGTSSEQDAILTFSDKLVNDVQSRFRG